MFNVVLPLHVGFALPGINAKMPGYINYTVANLNTCVVADELVRSSPFMDDIQQSIDKPVVRFHWINIDVLSSMTNENLSGCTSVVNSWSIQVDGVSSNILIMASNTKRWKWRLLCGIHVQPRIGTGSILSGVVVSVLDNVTGCIEEVRVKFFIFDPFCFNFTSELTSQTSREWTE